MTRFPTFPLIVLATVCTLTAACNDDGHPLEALANPLPTAAAPAALARNAELCITDECSDIVPLVDIPDAENILFSDDGRLFVTGGLNVYEVTKNADGSFAATPLADTECSFTGMAIRDGVLYVSGCDNTMFAGRITAQPVLTKIYDFVGTCIPNGTALGPDGKLYVVDEPLLPQCAPDPKIMRLTIDPNDPMKIAQQETWVQGSPAGLLFLGQDTTLRFPNGLVREGNTFYSTDGGSVFSVEWLPDGSAGPVTPLFFEPTAHDDLGLTADGLLVSDFFKGRVLLLSRTGELLQETAPLAFTAVSSVRLGRPPMFAPTDVLVTDKGIIGENSLPLDRLALIRRKAP